MLCRRAFYLAARPPRLRRERNNPSEHDHIRGQLSAHWREAQDAQDDEGKFGIGLPLRRLCGMRSAAWRKALPRGAFKVSFDRGASPTKLKVTCRISKTFSDEPSGAR